MCSSDLVGNYTEDDVVASARAWTGHGIDWTTMTYQFHSWDHDAGNKTFMGVTRAWDGPEIIDHILLTNTTTRMTACRFLTRKLWAYLAGDAPSDALVTRLAQVLYDNNLEMLPWVRALLVSDEFYATSARTGLVRSPIDFVVAVMHFTGYRAAALNPQWYLQGMGQQPFLPPNVAGYPKGPRLLGPANLVHTFDLAAAVGVPPMSRDATTVLAALGVHDVKIGRAHV